MWWVHALNMFVSIQQKINERACRIIKMYVDKSKWMQMNVANCSLDECRWDRGQPKPEGFGGLLPEPYTDTVLCVILGSWKGHGVSVETSRTEAAISRGQVLGQRRGGDNTVLVVAPGWAGHGIFTHCNCTLVNSTALYCTPVHSGASNCTITHIIAMWGTA